MPGASIERAYMVPGLPHLADMGAPGSSPAQTSYQSLKDAFRKAGENARATKPDVLVVYSGQWISVLGHSFQADPNPKGLHVDENWYDLGDFPFSFKVDVQLANSAAEQAQVAGLATKLVNYEGFPIDTGTLVTLKYFNPNNDIPVMIVSSNIYANAEDSNKLGVAVNEAIQKTGRKAVLINCSSMSYRFHTEEIEPKNDRIASERDDEWNRRVLDLLKSGKTKEVVKISDEYAKSAGPEMMFKGFHWMMGAVGNRDIPAEVMAYGPVYGTGAAVVEFQTK